MENECVVVGDHREVKEKFGTDYRIISTNAIEEMVKYSHINYEECISKQILSFSLFNKVVCSVGYNPIETNEISMKILLLGGIYSHDLPSRADFLISNNSFMKIVSVAMANGIPIVKKEWIDECFNTLSYVNHQDYHVPLFLGFVFTSSDLNGDDQKEYKQIVEKHGGKWLDNFNDDVSMLISRSITSTQKIRYALMNQVPIVFPEWINDSLSSIRPLNDYSINSWIFNEPKKRIFDGFTFAIHHTVPLFDSVVAAIKHNSGTICQNPSLFVVPHDFKFENSSTQYVTSRWIWDCIIRRSILPVSSSALYFPLPYSIPVPSVQGKLFAVLIRNEVLRIEIIEIIRLLGGKVVFRESKQAHYLVSNQNESSQKRSQTTQSITPSMVSYMLKCGGLPEQIPKSLSIPIIIKPAFEEIEIMDFSQNSPSPLIEIKYHSRSLAKRDHSDEKDPILEEL